MENSYNTSNTKSELLKLSINSITKKCKALKLSTEGGKMDMIERIVSKSNHNELTSKRNDMLKIANVLLGETSDIFINDLLNSYTKQSLENNINKQWIQIVEKFKQINDNIKNSKTNTLKLKDNTSYDINEETDNLIASFNNDELTEMKETLNSNTNINNQINKLKIENEKYISIIRTKDEIITNANGLIKILQNQLLTIKEEKQQKEIQMDPIKRIKAKQLLQKRVQCEQANAIKVDKEGDKKTISEMLNDSTKENAKDIINSMGVLKFEYDKTLKKDMYTLNMTNNPTLRRLTNDQRKQFIHLFGHCLINKDNSAHVEKVKITNIGIDDKLFPSLIDIFIENVQYFFTKEIWMESNKIGNVGMLKLAEFIALNPKTLQVIKMYNNKAIISSKTINILLTALEKNTQICKFTFEWRLSQHRDRIDKVLRANQERRRKEKWAKKTKK
eukprot:41697_1